MSSNVIIKNSSFKLMTFGVGVVLTFLLTPFIINSLGDAEYGIWVLVGSISGFFLVMDLGISSSVIRYVAKFNAQDDPDSLNSVVNTCLFLYGLIAIFVLIASLVVAFFLPAIIELPAGSEFTTSLVIIIIGASAAITFPFKVFAGILKALMRYDITSSVDLLINILRALLIVFALKNQGGLLSLAIITFLTMIVMHGLNIYFSFKKYPQLRLGWKYVSKSKTRSIFNYSVFTFIASFGNMLRFNLDSIVIGAVLTVSAITPYSLAQKLITYFMLLIGELVSVTTPLYSSYESKNDFKSIQNLLVKSTFYCALISFFIAAMFVVYGDTFIYLWMGAEYAQESYLPLVILSVSFAVFLSQNPTIVAAYGIEKHKVLAIVTLLEGVLNLVLSLILAKKMGLVGVALGTAIPLLLTRAIIQPAYICRVIKLPYAKYFKECFFVPLIVVAMFLATQLLFKSYVRLDNFFLLTVGVVVSSLVFLALSIVLLTSEQRQFWKSKIARLRERFAS